MTPLVHAEVLKLRTTRSTGWLLLATLATEALMVSFSIPKRGDQEALVPLDDPGLLRSSGVASLASASPERGPGRAAVRSAGALRTAAAAQRGR